MFYCRSETIQEDNPVAGVRGYQTPATPALWAEHAQAATLSQSVSLLQGLKASSVTAIDP